jgi:hypothetical protein
MLLLAWAKSHTNTVQVLLHELLYLACACRQLNLFSWVDRRNW